MFVVSIGMYRVVPVVVVFWEIVGTMSFSAPSAVSSAFAAELTGLSHFALKSTVQPYARNPTVKYK